MTAVARSPFFCLKADNVKTPNRRSIVVPLLLCSVFAACAEPPRFLGISEPTLKDQGQHHKTWQRVSSYMTSYGRVVTRTNTYQEIGTGMSWLDREANPPVWRDTEESIEVFPAGGIARKGPHQLIISPQLAGETPTLDIMTPDGKRLLCSLFGLVYRDPVSGNNVMIAEPNPDAVATLVSSQRVVFENALLDYSASLQITYTRAGVESELILHENIDPPSEWNLSPETRLTVWSEWFDLPEVRKEVHLVAGESDALARQLMAEPDRIDETIIFGEMRLTQGSAFQVGEGASTDSIIVSKQLVEVEGRTFLIESADYREIEPMLKALDLARNAAPAPGPKLQLAKRQPAKSLTELVASVAGTRPSARDIDSFASRRSEILTSALVPAQAPAFEMARSDYQQRRGVSVDWTAVISQTNTIFKANETYFCSSLVNLAGTTVIEGGTCVKFSPTNNPAIWFFGAGGLPDFAGASGLVHSSRGSQCR